MFFGQFYEKWVSVRERNIKLLLEPVTCIAITEIVTCIIKKKKLYGPFLWMGFNCLKA